MAENATLTSSPRRPGKSLAAPEFASRSSTTGCSRPKDGVTGGGYFVSNGTGEATFVKRVAGASGFPRGNHGTFCLGVAGARMNKKQGGCGAAPEATLIPVACLDDQVGTQTTLGEAIGYAADPRTKDETAPATDGADVIACSLGPNGGTWVLYSSLALAIESLARGRGGKGVPLFWAVSNGAFDVALDGVCSHPDVIAVGRSNPS